MDAIDFQTWLSDCFQKFPAIREWVRSIKPTTDQDALLNAWSHATKDLELADCLAVNMRMLSGELEPPGEFPSQWQGLPSRVRRHAAAVSAERCKESAADLRGNREHERTVIVREALKAGRPRSAIDAYLRASGFDGIALEVSPRRKVTRKDGRR